MSATVVVLTKLPGRLPVKTRLVPLLGEQGAARFYIEMLEATIRLARTLDPDPVLAYSPPDADPRAAYFRQVQNGMYIRMALLAAVLGKA